MVTNTRFFAFRLLIIIAFIQLACASFLSAASDQDADAAGLRVIKSPINGDTYKPYPHTYDQQPMLPSPFKSFDGSEYIVVCIKDKEYGIIPVTVENTGKFPKRKHPYFKGKQLALDDIDFPTLASTGLHSEWELDETRNITGKPVVYITEVGRPGQISTAGFLAEDEDIISVLRGDNRIVSSLGLTHPEMARPLYHVWNAVLLEYDLGRASRHWEPFEYLLYYGKKVHLKVQGSRGFQESIFNDEIRGACRIWLHRDLNQEELKFLEEKYSRLNAEEMNKMIEALTHIHTGEMVPYYIMRYGFYEGHTSYRADPIAIAFIFGLKSLEEIEAAFEGRLYETLTEHFR